MWARQVLLAFIGISAGAVIAAGLFAFIIGLGIVADFADRTHTAKHIRFYETCLMAGGIVGNLLSLYQPQFSRLPVLLGIFGICSGIFVGCWYMALAETLNMFPIFIRRAKIMKGIPYLIVGVALGKAVGAFIYFWNGW